jgi:hypothetical protein
MLQQTLAALIRRLGRTFARRELRGRNQYPPDIPQGTIDVYEAVRPYTMTSIERLGALVEG